MQDALPLMLDFKLTWNVASGKGFRTYCKLEACNVNLTEFSLNPNQPGLLHGFDGWTIDFAAGDNRFVETQGVYTEDHGTRTPIGILHFGYCSSLPLDRRG